MSRIHRLFVAWCGLCSSWVMAQVMPMEVGAPSATVQLVEVLALVPAVQNHMQDMLIHPRLSDPKHPRRLLAQQVVALPVPALQAVLARVLDKGLAAADIRRVAEFQQSALGRKFEAFVRQRDALDAQGASPPAVPDLARFTAGLSADELRDLEAYVSTNAASRVIGFIDSPRFEAGLAAEVKALP